MKKELNIKNLEVVELNKSEKSLTNGGSWLSYVIGYLANKNYQLYQGNTSAPWNAMGSK